MRCDDAALGFGVLVVCDGAAAGPLAAFRALRPALDALMGGVHNCYVWENNCVIGFASGSKKANGYEQAM